MKALSRTLIAAALLAASSTLGACKVIDEKPCSEGSYPVTASDGSGGSTCAESGKPIPSGYTTYPPGQTPTTA